MKNCNVASLGISMAIMGVSCHKYGGAMPASTTDNPDNAPTMGKETPEEHQDQRIRYLQDRG